MSGDRLVGNELLGLLSQAIRGPRIDQQHLGSRRLQLLGLGEILPHLLIADWALIPPVTANAAASIRFIRSQIQTAIASGTTILEAAEAAGIDLPFECRSGICGQCKLSLTEGQVQMDCQDALSASEKAARFVLACQAKPLLNLVVDA